MREDMEMNITTGNALIASIAFSILGIALIAAADYEAELNKTNISKIDSTLAGENVITCGIVKSKSVSQSGTTFVTLEENGRKIPLVFFKNEMHEAENMSRKEYICAKGVVQIYNGSPEIIGRNIIAPA